MNSVVVDVWTSNRAVEEEMMEKFLFCHKINHMMLDKVIPFESLRGQVNTSLLNHVYGTGLSATEKFSDELEDTGSRGIIVEISIKTSYLLKLHSCIYLRC